MARWTSENTTQAKFAERLYIEGQRISSSTLWLSASVGKHLRTASSAVHDESRLVIVDDRTLLQLI
jgi:hypothetical protein